MDKDETFFKKWSAVRKKGKLFYIFSRGLLFGFLLFSVWAIVTVLFEKERYKPDSVMFLFIIQGALYIIWGFLIASVSWKSKEKKFTAFKVYFDKHTESV